MPDRRPDGTYVPRNPPRVCKLLNPCPRIIPAAYIDVDVPARHTVNHLTDFLIAVPFLKTAINATAVVNLDEVEVPVVEILVSVLNIVHPETRTNSVQVLVVARPAGVVSGVGIDSGLQAERVDVVGDGAHLR